ncbi:MAG TPA: alpha-amylase family glycosyl hydrolase [Ardenticatenaceae bacterium]
MSNSRERGRLARLQSQLPETLPMEDHIFGTFSTDRLKFLHERASAQGVQHQARRLPLDPVPGEPLTLVATTGPDVVAQELVARYTTDGSAPTEESAAVPFTIVARRWSTAAWGYVTEWHAELPGWPEGTLLRYEIVARLADGTWHAADWPQPRLVVEETLVKGEDEPLVAEQHAPSRFALSIDRFAPPEWAQNGLIYQLFLDRFAREDEWPKPPTLFDIHGGTLRGAIEKLEHVANLGATCIWLSPLFPSPTHHGYDATDYYEVEPRLGTKEDLRELVDRAHALGMRVLLDFIANHVSSAHPRFQEALAGPDSEARGWFQIDQRYIPLGYRSFFGVATMPELNTDHPAVRDYLVGAAEMWVRDFDVDGFRLDYAHGPSYSFWAHFWSAVKRIKPDAWCFGEVVDTPGNQLTYAGYLDGVLDFHLGDGLRRVFAFETLDLVWLDHFLRDHEAFFPPHEQFSRPTFLDNHDMDRFLFAAGGSIHKLRLAALVLYALPNPPILYYGTEVALPQRRSKNDGWGLEVSREPMNWSLTTGNAELLTFFQRLGALRRDEPAMRPDQRETLSVAPEHYLARHTRGSSELFLALNRATTPAALRHEKMQGTFRDLLTDEVITLEGTLHLKAQEGRLLKRL